jgi:hypothetical protein
VEDGLAVGEDVEQQLSESFVRKIVNADFAFSDLLR